MKKKKKEDKKRVENKLLNKENKKNFKKLFSLLLVFVLFVLSTIAIYMNYNNSYSDPTIKMIKKILKKEKVKYKGIVPYGIEDTFKVYAIVIDENKILPFYITRDNEFFGVQLLPYYNKTINSSEDLKEVLSIYSTIFPIVPRRFKKIGEKKEYNYSVYIIDPSEPYYQSWQNIYFIVSKDKVLIAQPNIYN